jgi:hypothetical protein
VEGKTRDDDQLLGEGIRYLTVARRNIPSSVPMLIEPLPLTFDPETGLSDAAKPAVVGIYERSNSANGCSQLATPKAPEAKVTINVSDADAHAAALVIRMIERDTKKPLAVTGKKNLFYLKGPSELKGWSRSRCESAHRRAVELKLC